MLIFLAPRIVLLSIPKTGTTALEQALARHAEIAFRTRPEIKHLTLRQHMNRIQPLLAPLGAQPFRTVAVMREPSEWLASWYRFRARDQLIGHPNSTATVSYDRFVRDYLSTGERPAYARIGRQSDFILGTDGKPGVDLLFRYEAMEALTAFLATELGCQIKLPRANVSPDATTELFPETDAMLKGALATEYDIWDNALQGAP